MASTGDKHGDNQWSTPVKLAMAAKRLPVLVRLEEGHHGRTEETCFSQGDVLALQSCDKVRSRDVVLAHYLRESDLIEGAKAAPKSGLYQALMAIYLDNEDLADLDVSMLQDPSGHGYQTWVKEYFPSCNWADKDSKAYDAFASGDIEDDDDIVVYMSYTNVATVKTDASLEPVPPKSPEPGKKMPQESTNSPSAKVGGGLITSSPPPRPPPLRPPKSGALRASTPTSHPEPTAPPPVQPRLPARPLQPIGRGLPVVGKNILDQEIQDYDAGEEDKGNTEGQYEEVRFHEAIYEINPDDEGHLKPVDHGSLTFTAHNAPTPPLRAKPAPPPVQPRLPARPPRPHGVGLPVARQNVLAQEIQDYDAGEEDKGNTEGQYEEMRFHEAIYEINPDDGGHLKPVDHGSLTFTAHNVPTSPLRAKSEPTAPPVQPRLPARPPGPHGADLPVARQNVLTQEIEDYDAGEEDKGNTEGQYEEVKFHETIYDDGGYLKPVDHRSFTILAHNAPAPPLRGEPEPTRPPLVQPRLPVRPPQRHGEGRPVIENEHREIQDYDPGGEEEEEKGSDKGSYEQIALNEGIYEINPDDDGQQSYRGYETVPAHNAPAPPLRAGPESEDPYTEIDEKSRLWYGPRKGGKPAPPPPESTAKDRNKGTKQGSSASEQKVGSKKPMVKVSPLQKSSPSSKQSDDKVARVGDVQRLKSSPIATMSVAELASRLQQCGMEKVSQICQDCHVDGSFFLDLDAKQLKAAPFSLSDWDITRVEKVQTGWVPKENEQTD